ncbi:hypothetical protein [Rhizobium leguminosarum]|uniref:hypothetical protein n=1 Tax=Rhizobium leguminosarum TaxID=384 RepID=UPI0013E367CA|nr:hypothetical protein [Rhizobium leguminosarum]
MADKPAIQAVVTAHLRVNVDEVECKTSRCYDWVHRASRAAVGKCDEAAHQAFQMLNAAR